MDVRTSAARPILALAADVVALTAFALVGVETHDGGLPAAPLARVGIPLVGAWLVATWVVGTYRRTGLARLVLAWALAVPAGVLVRTAIAGGPWGRGFFVFLAVALAFTLLFLLAARALVWACATVAARAARRANEADAS